METYEDSVESLLGDIARESKATGEPRAAIVLGWNHDLIIRGLEARGVRFVEGKPSFDSEVAYARNREGKWIVETWRTDPKPRSVVIHQPQTLTITLGKQCSMPIKNLLKRQSSS